MRLKDKMTIVTGGGGEKGIGRAIVRAFAKEGADVCIVGRNQKAGEEAAEEVRQCGGRALSLICDISKLDEIDCTVKRVFSEWGRIDVLVNNAGISIPGPFLEVTPEDARRIWDVNMLGSFFMTQRVARHMVERAKQRGYKVGDPIIGKIVNMSSLSEEVGTLNVSPYAMTKAAIKLLTRCTALELAPYGILVNAIGAGFIKTNIVDIPDEAYDERAKTIPLKRCGVGDDIAGAAVFLASNESDYATGMTLMVDGGYTAQ